MRLIADAGNAPSEEIVERFLNRDGKYPGGADYSPMPHFCRTNELPLADWRDYRELSVNVGAPGEGRDR
jgi:hypothetical protein